MLPLRDNIPSRTTPFVNYALIVANAAVFFHELSLGRQLPHFIATYGIVPLTYAAHGQTLERLIVPLFSSMFLHGGWLHVISNMWCLWIFGDNVEDALGHGKYLLFYVLCGLAAAAAQIWASWGSPLPTLGASGAIAGVMGAYLILYPHARVLTLLPIFIFVKLVEVPASLFLGIWIWSQLYSGAFAVGNAGRLGGVAWWAHIGGFLSGIVMLGVFLAGGGSSPRRRR
jgi:membrane associated rhomboid family serine protease